MQEKAPHKLALLIVATLLVDVLAIGQFLTQSRLFPIGIPFIPLALAHGSAAAIWFASGWPDAGWSQRALRAATLIGVVLTSAALLHLVLPGPAPFIPLFGIPAGITAIIVLCWYYLEQHIDFEAANRRVQYSLRALFLLMTVAAVFCGVALKAPRVMIIVNPIVLAWAGVVVFSSPLRRVVQWVILGAMAVLCTMAVPTYVAGIGYSVVFNFPQAVFLAAWLQWGGILRLPAAPVSRQFAEPS